MVLMRRRRTVYMDAACGERFGWVWLVERDGSGSGLVDVAAVGLLLGLFARMVTMLLMVVRLIVWAVCIVRVHVEEDVDERQRQYEGEQQTEDVGGVALIHAQEIALVEHFHLFGRMGGV